MTICSFPGCTRPAAPAPAAGGRPPKYCDLPEHNRTTAFRAKQAAAAARADQAGEQAVSLASARLRLVIESLAPMLAGHREAVASQVAAALESLDDIGDPAMVEAEIGAVRAEAMRQASEAEADAERARREAAGAAAAAEQAQSARDKAVADAAAAEQRASAADAGERAARDEAREAVEALTAIRAELEAALARAEMAEAKRDGESQRAQRAEGERDAATLRADQAESALASVRQEVQDARQAATEAAAASAAALARTEAAQQALEDARREARRVEEREVARADREIERIAAMGQQRIAELEAELVKLRAPRRGRGTKDDA